jgi:hypothetical protein
MTPSLMRARKKTGLALAVLTIDQVVQHPAQVALAEQGVVGLRGRAIQGFKAGRKFAAAQVGPMEALALGRATQEHFAVLGAVASVRVAGLE